MWAAFTWKSQRVPFDHAWRASMLCNTIQFEKSTQLLRALTRDLYRLVSEQLVCFGCFRYNLTHIHLLLGFPKITQLSNIMNIFWENGGVPPSKTFSSLWEERTKPQTPHDLLSWVCDWQAVINVSLPLSILSLWPYDPMTSVTSHFTCWAELHFGVCVIPSGGRVQNYKDEIIGSDRKSVV